MDQILLHVAALISAVVAGVNLATAIINSRNRKKPSSSQPKKGSTSSRE